MLFQYETIDAVQTKLLERNPARTSWIIFNTHASAVVYIHQFEGVSLVTGFPIQPGGSFTAKIPEDDPTFEIWIISDTAGTNIRFYEGFGHYPKAWKGG